MRFVFLGPPGAGKGTQAKLLSARLELAHISTGEMLRGAVQAQTALGLKVKSLMESGHLVPDDIIITVIRDRIREKDCIKGYVLDGFPRTVLQAEALAKMLDEESSTLDSVVFFEISEAVLQDRLTHRRGSESRVDDDAAIQLERLRVYKNQTAPLIEYYDKSGLLIRIDATGSVDAVYDRLFQAISS